MRIPAVDIAAMAETHCPRTRSLLETAALRLYPNLLHLSAPVKSTNTSISGWPWKTCIPLTNHFCCLATITIFYLVKLDTCKNLQMVLTSTQVPVSVIRACRSSRKSTLGFSRTLINLSKYSCASGRGCLCLSTLPQALNRATVLHTVNGLTHRFSPASLHDLPFIST